MPAHDGQMMSDNPDLLHELMARVRRDDPSQAARPRSDCIVS